MTKKQQDKLHRLIEAVEKAYKAMQQNTDREKQEELNRIWVKACEKADRYNPE